MVSYLNCGPWETTFAADYSQFINYAVKLSWHNLPDRWEKRYYIVWRIAGSLLQLAALYAMASCVSHNVPQQNHVQRLLWLTRAGMHITIIKHHVWYIWRLVEYKNSTALASSNSSVGDPAHPTTDPILIHKAKNEISHLSCGHEIWHFINRFPPIL